MSDEIRPGYTRVTEILDQWNTKVVVDGECVAKAFAGSRTAIDIGVLNHKAQCGTNVHEAIEWHLQGFEKELSVKEQPYFESFVKWFDQVKPTFIKNEQRYYCEQMKITGCVDGIMKMPGSDDLMIIDFKTSANESPKMWPLQATFYHYLASLDGTKLSDRLIFLKLHWRGDMAEVFEYKYTPHLLQVCKCAVFNYRYLNS